MNTLGKFTAILLMFAFEVAASPDSKFDIIANLDTGPGNVTVTDNWPHHNEHASVLSAEIHRG